MVGSEVATAVVVIVLHVIMLLGICYNFLAVPAVLASGQCPGVCLFFCLGNGLGTWNCHVGLNIQVEMP